MRCSRCQHEDTKVIESRDVADGQAVRRRRACIACNYRFTTYERIERPQLIVVKNDGTRQLFNREKLLAGLYRACEKTPVGSVQLDQLVGLVEDKLHECEEPEVTSAKIGELAMEALATINEVAYVRFASVYKQFKNIEGFEKELSLIRQQRAVQTLK